MFVKPSKWRRQKEINASGASFSLRTPARGRPAAVPRLCARDARLAPPPPPTRSRDDQRTNFRPKFLFPYLEVFSGKCPLKCRSGGGVGMFSMVFVVITLLVCPALPTLPRVIPVSHHGRARLSLPFAPPHAMPRCRRGGCGTVASLHSELSVEASQGRRGMARDNSLHPRPVPRALPRAPPFPPTHLCSRAELHATCAS